jgi:hypothetical protein
VNTSTRIVSNLNNFGPENGEHCIFWIYTDVSLDDHINISNIWKAVHTGNGDTEFNITGETTHGTMNVWILEDQYGSEVWYEKTKGFLVNGTFTFSGDYHTYEYVSHSFPSTGNGGPVIPGYDLLLILGVTSLIGINLIKQNRKKI